MDEEEYSTIQAAELWGMSERTVRYMIESGEIKARYQKVNPFSKKGVWKIPQSQIDRVLKLKTFPVK